MIQQISDDLLWSQIVARAWCDQGFMKRLLSNPRDVLSEHGLEVPEGREVRVEEGAEVKVEEDDSMVCRFVLPVNPPDELTDEDLDGHAVSWCGWCGGCGCRCRCYC
jgi:hypothetical protein